MVSLEGSQAPADVCHHESIVGAGVGTGDRSDEEEEGPR